MIATYQRLQRRREAGEINGFTLIELLIVIVVLGILAAVVIFALGGITGKSAVAACQADGATVSTAMSAFTAQNPGTLVQQGLLLPSGATPANGGPYLQSWPSNGSHYVFSIDGAGKLNIALPATTSPVFAGYSGLYTGPSICQNVQ